MKYYCKLPEFLELLDKRRSDHLFAHSPITLEIHLVCTPCKLIHLQNMCVESFNHDIQINSEQNANYQQ